MPNSKRVDFDQYVDRYEDLLSAQLAFFSKDRSYFSDYKAQLVASLLVEKPNQILDFGCGIGLNLRSLASSFDGSALYATDRSTKSLDCVRDNYPDVRTIAESELGSQSFDLIFVAGVFHHVPPKERKDVIRQLEALLAPGGHICIFEHNPFNPITRKLVSTCPFDEDAELISFREMKRLVEVQSRFSIEYAGYCLFFPEKLRRLLPFEKYLRWAPLGGQYFVHMGS